MAGKIWTKLELDQQTKLGLRRACEELGIQFSNEMDHEALKQAILDAQNRGTAQDAQNPDLDDDEDGDDGGTNTEDEAGYVTVTCGGQSDVFQFAGKSVSWIRSHLREIYNIDPKAEPLINGQKVNEQAVVEEGNHLEFVKQSGVKQT